MRLGFMIRIIIVILLLGNCTRQKETVTKLADYEQYLDTGKNTALEKVQTEKDFWENKLEKHPDQYAYLQPLAAAYAGMFEVSGTISHLLKAEALLLEANARLDHKNAGLQRALARNYITQHRFKEALTVLKNAEQTGEDLKNTQQMLFDVHLELGNITQAEEYLGKIKAMNEFDYLIRLSKWSDYKGNLDAAIKYMEKAIPLAEASGNKGLQSWAYSNLADFYGHAGRIEDAYSHYLKTLEINPDHAYALKGIAWIAFSYEKDVEKAQRIMDVVTAKYKTPDTYLFKAELAAYNGDKSLEAEHMKKYQRLLATNNYGVMYDKHNTLLWAEDNSTLDKAMALAMQEVANRPTAQSYDLLAWTYLGKGNEKKALEIALKHVIGKTYEPEVQYHIAEIYKANNMHKEAKALKKELMESLFELGPNMETRIMEL